MVPGRGGARWVVYWRVAGVSEVVVALPSAVRRTVWDGLACGYLLPPIWVTAAEMAMGLAAGCTIGFLAGVLLAEVPVLRRLFYPYILASQVVPKLALGPLFIVWFGFGMTSTVVITALICFFPLLENTMTGLQQVDPNKRELFRMLRATRLQTLLRLKIPSGLPVILAGLRVAVVLALVGAVVGEFIGGRQGLGASIIAAQGMMDSTMMFALFIVITVLGMIVYQAAAGLERWLLRRPWKG
ncbi:ABC transporter permease subunit [Azospirillum brasilense]|nr:ABC transporter permease subunit [Azospirillum brasilense]